VLGRLDRRVQLGAAVDDHADHAALAVQGRVGLQEAQLGLHLGELVGVRGGVFGVDDPDEASSSRRLR